jgi:4'-phosphopantetheinyl transferase
LVRLLDAGEQERLSRLYREQDRALFLAAHALTRIVLSAHLGMDPRAIRFSNICRYCGARHGKPQIDPPCPLDFSISHSGQRAVVAIATGAVVGVDVECVTPLWGDAALVSMMLSNSEKLIVDGFQGRARDEALFRYWTRKEAILKATGHGLAVSPSSITVSSPYHAPALLVWTAKIPVEAAFLYDLDAGPEHVASLATLDAELKISEHQANEMLANHDSPPAFLIYWHHTHTTMSGNPDSAERDSFQHIMLNWATSSSQSVRDYSGQSRRVCVNEEMVTLNHFQIKALVRPRPPFTEMRLSHVFVSGPAYHRYRTVQSVVTGRRGIGFIQPGNPPGSEAASKPATPGAPITTKLIDADESKTCSAGLRICQRATGPDEHLGRPFAACMF